MILVADEGVDWPIVERLRDEGHRVTYMAEEAPQSPDDDVLRSAETMGALLVTTDRDFGDLVFRQHLVHSGVMLLRLAGLPNATKASLVANVLRVHGDEMIGAFSVLSPGQLRIRRSR